MSTTVAEVVVRVAGLYLACGAVFAALFLWRWAGRLDPGVAHGTRGFRAIVFPGVVALWPFLVTRLVRGARAPLDEWTAHRRVARRAVPPRRAEEPH